MRAAILGGRESVRRSLSTSDHNNHNQLHNSQRHDPDALCTSSRISSASRTPLHSTDNNAKMRTPLNGPVAAKQSNKTMPPYDKQQNMSSRPLVPTLSTTTKSTTRTPLTPRVAASAPPSSTSPLARRRARGGDTPVASSKEEISSPISTFLNNNITPRSGSRKSRVDSGSTTPTGTPNGTPVLASSSNAFRGTQESPSHGPGLGIMGMDRDPPSRSNAAIHPAASGAGSSRSPLQNSGSESKFFFASDAKTVQPVRPTMPSKNSSTFFYASGEILPTLTQPSGASAVGSVVGDDGGQSKFVHLNRASEASPAHTHYPSRPGSSLSTASRMTTTRIGSQSPGVTFSPPPQPRPASPSKLNQYATASSARSNPIPTTIESVRPLVTVRGNSTNSVVMARPENAESSSRIVSHGRSSSSGSSGLKSPGVRNLSRGSSVDFPIAISAGPIPTPAAVPTTGDSSKEPKTIEFAPQSPTKAGQNLEQLNELAANARRERKVLDLEITNSSLAAINRTLEREMRKQTAELRRYRRLSRSGRLSIATTTSMRTSTGTLSVIGEDGMPLSDMSEEEEEDVEDEDEFSDEEFSDEGSLSPGAMAASDARHRKKDEKRLQLDLSKHQQLLIDSQKMNQSLKRCLGLTEELIGEGKKALEYKVQVSDIELGGRVLARDDEADSDMMRQENRRGLETTFPQQMDMPVLSENTAPWGGSEKDYRDSGIEVDPLGGDVMAVEQFTSLSPELM